MGTIITKSELVNRALRFISESLAENPDQSKADLIDEAAMRFNLSPKESDSLLRILTAEKNNN